MLTFSKLDTNCINGFIQCLFPIMFLLIVKEQIINSLEVSEVYLHNVLKGRVATPGFGIMKTISNWRKNQSLLRS